MQEPILFDQTIKENILYGKETATDAEILRVCELANARSFIEDADIDRLEGDDLTERLEEDLTKALKKKEKKYFMISEINVKHITLKVTDKNKYLALLLKVLTMSDKKALKLIDQDVERMLDQLKTEIDTISGLRWDDFVVRFE